MKLRTYALLGPACALLAAGTALSGWAQPVANSWLTLDEMEQGTPQAAAGWQTIEPAAGPIAQGDVMWETPTSADTPLTSGDLSDMIYKALERQDWRLAEHYARQLAPAAATDKDRATAAYGLALSLTQQARYDEALQALRPLENANKAFQQAANKLAGTLHLQIAELALLDGDKDLAQRHLQTYEYYANTHTNQARAQRLRNQLNGVQAQEGYLRVGVLLPLTGPHANIGKSLLNAMQEAVFTDVASKIVLYPEDTGSEAQDAVKALAKLENLRVDAVIGPLLSPQVDAIKNALPANHMPFLALSSDPHVAAPNMHLLSYRPDQQARLIARHAVSLGRTRLAALVPSTPYGYEVFDAFRDEVSNLGADMVVTNFYNPDTPDVSGALETLLQLDLARHNLRKERDALQKEYSELGNALPDEKLQRLKALKTAKPEAVVAFDALFLPARADRLSLITSQMAVYDLDRQDVMLLGTAAWDSPSLQRGGDYVREGRFPALPEEQHFTQRFTDDFSQSPNVLSALGYDAVRILADAAGQPGDLATNLLRPEGFPGVGGAIRFHADGLSERAYALKALTPNEVIHVEQSPKILPPALPVPLMPTESAPVWRYSPW